MKFYIGSLLIFFNLIVHFTNVYSQTKVDSNSDAITYEQKQAIFRDYFWNNLPKPTRWTNDYEGLYSERQKDALDSLIKSFKDYSGIEIIIVTVDSMYVAKEKINQLTVRFLKTWKVDQQSRKNIVLIGICSGYGMVSMQNGDSIKKLLSRDETRDIIENYFIPYFKVGDFYEGTSNGLIKLMEVLIDKKN